MIYFILLGIIPLILLILMGIDSNNEAKFIIWLCSLLSIIPLIVIFCIIWLIMQGDFMLATLPTFILGAGIFVVLNEIRSEKPIKGK